MVNYSRLRSLFIFWVYNCSTSLYNTLEVLPSGANATRLIGELTLEQAKLDWSCEMQSPLRPIFLNSSAKAPTCSVKPVMCITNIWEVSKIVYSIICLDYSSYKLILIFQQNAFTRSHIRFMDLLCRLWTSKYVEAIVDTTEARSNGIAIVSSVTGYFSFQKFLYASLYFRVKLLVYDRAAFGSRYSALKCCRVKLRQFSGSLKEEWAVLPSFKSYCAS